MTKEADLSYLDEAARQNQEHSQKMALAAKTTLPVSENEAKRLQAIAEKAERNRLTAEQDPIYGLTSWFGQKN